jgi:hypothetical protein
LEVPLKSHDQLVEITSINESNGYLEVICLLGRSIPSLTGFKGVIFIEQAIVANWEKEALTSLLTWIIPPSHMS